MPFNPKPNQHPALLLDSQYDELSLNENQSIRGTIGAFLPNVEEFNFAK